MGLKSNPDVVSDERIAKEIRAEAFRLWSLHLVRTQTEKQINTVRDELANRFFDASSATGPFSATAIYGKVSLSTIVKSFATNGTDGQSTTRVAFQRAPYQVCALARS